MFEGKSIKVGRRYIYVFDNCFDDEFRNGLIAESEKRYEKLKAIVMPEFKSWKRPYYVLEETEGEPRGSAYNGMIKCQIPKEHHDGLPMYHEETHMVVFQMIGDMSYAWSEGFAEYFACLLYEKTEYLSGVEADFATLDSMNYYHDILFSLTHEDQQFFNMLRQSNKFYSMSLASFIHFVRLKLGEDAFRNLLNNVVQKEYEELGIFIGEWFEQWFFWSKENNKKGGWYEV